MHCRAGRACTPAPCDAPPRMSDESTAMDDGPRSLSSKSLSRDTAASAYIAQQTVHTNDRETR